MVAHIMMGDNQTLFRLGQVVHHNGVYYTCGHEVDAETWVYRKACIYAVNAFDFTTIHSDKPKHANRRPFAWTFFKYKGKLYAAYIGQRKCYYYLIDDCKCTPCVQPRKGADVTTLRLYSPFSYSNKYVICSSLDLDDVFDAFEAFISPQAAHQVRRASTTDLFIYNKHTHQLRQMNLGEDAIVVNIAIADDEMTFAVSTEEQGVFIFDLEEE